MLFKKKKVVFVEDNEGVRLTGTNILEDWGYAVFTADNGNDALKIIKEKSPDLIILDVKIPGINGFDLCRLLKENPATKKIPVVLLTGLSKIKEVDRGYYMGADLYLTKPIDWFTLKLKIEKLI